MKLAKERLQKHCKCCNRTFTTTSRKKIYCSSKCRLSDYWATHEIVPRLKPSDMKRCLQCNRTFEKDLSDYCCRTCKEDWETHQRAYVGRQMKCECGKIFTSMDNDHLFCSPDCKTSYIMGRQPVQHPDFGRSLIH